MAINFDLYIYENIKYADCGILRKMNEIQNNIKKETCGNTTTIIYINTGQFKRCFYNLNSGCVQSYSHRNNCMKYMLDGENIYTHK